MHIVIVLGFFLLIIHDTSAVDRNNFKTCDESGFCKRQRQYSPSSTPYHLVPDSLVVGVDDAHFEVVNIESEKAFVLRLTGYSNGVVRVYMNEKLPLKPRYEVPPGDVVLEDQLTVQRFVIDKRDSASFQLSLLETDTKVKVTSPFLLEVMTIETPVLQINSRGLLKFEHLRTKPGLLSSAVETTSGLASRLIHWLTSPFRESPPVEEAKEENEDDEGAEAPAEEETESKEEPKQEEEHSMWDERYKTHTDAKPNGPTSIGVDMTFVGFEHVYGIPEHGDNLALKSTVDSDPYRLYNLDVFEHDLHNGMALYGSVPVMLAHSAYRTIGVFWNNPSEMWIDIRSSKADRSTLGKIVDFVTQDDTVPQMETRWMAESGVLDLFVMMGPAPNDVFKQYAGLTGTTRLPPIFSLAYHQSRWNYNDEADVKQIHDNFDKYDIPLDVVWLDIEHTDGKRYFTWDGGKFPNSLDMVDKLSAKGRKLVTIVDPHIKRDDNYHIYKELKEKDFFVQRSGSEFDGWCWPGSSSYPDFTRPDMREWWANKFHYDQYTGTNEHVFTWNDMNEPSVFNGPEITMHKDATHAGGWEHRDIHNLYGMYVQRATAEGQILRSGGKHRPFVLSRAFYAGSQRFGAVWTGDNMGEWSFLKISVAMVLSQSITGITFTGADIGGFFKNPSAELVTRWYQTGAFLPFYRAHSHLDTRRREPWLLDEENRNIIRDAIITRYQLLPYWYTLFYVNEKEGLPPARPMWSEFPTDTNGFSEDEQFMIGSGILVRPVLDEGASSVPINFPGGPQTIWYAGDSYQPFPGASKQDNYPVTLSSIPYFYRGGHIIPRKERVRRSSVQMKDDPYTFVVVLDTQGKSTGDLYIDDYKSFEYEQGKYIYRRFTFDNGQLTSRAIDITDFETASWLEAVNVIGMKSKPEAVTLTVNGKDSDLSYTFAEHLTVVRKPKVNMALDWTITIS
ncbi:neutral alpha-glucosidase AB-like isoform X3 [Watersipora subatra]|uniref:neutral alpha-glucosidase AB-like isoform X3 n=1 Tax=Watersipora subatra TaxID=2589382 RepID=UPI00355C3180